MDNHNLFFEFLDYINAPSEWYDYYDGLLEEDRLTIEIVKDQHAGTKKQDEEGEQIVNAVCGDFKPIIKNGKVFEKVVANYAFGWDILWIIIHNTIYQHLIS